MKHRYKLVTTAVLLAASATAQAQIYKAVLSGANEVPAVTTAGTGVGVVSLNTTTHEMRVSTTFSGLNGNTTAAHIHCCTAPGANAGVATQTPTFTGFPAGVTAGTYNTTFNMGLAPSWNAAFITANGGTPAGAEAALSAGLDGGRAYLNIHSSTSPGGEIRGNLVRFSFATAASPRTASLAAALDALGAGTGAVNERLVAMASLGNPQQLAAMESLAPISANVVVATLTNSLYADYDQISNRLAGLRGDTTHGTWFRYTNRHNEHELSGRGADAESNGWDVGVGHEMRMASGWVLGAALSFAEDELDYSGALAGSTGDLEGWRATAYTEGNFGSAFVEGMATYAQHDGDAMRNLGAINGLASSTSDADQWGVRLAVGTDLVSGIMTATPQLRVDWSNLDIDGYQEVAAGGLGLVVNSQDIDSLRISLGGQIEWDTAEDITPFVRGFWTTELEDDDFVTVSRFSAGGSAFTTTDAGPESSGFTAGVGINFTSSETLAASISYDVIDNDDFESDLVQVRALWKF
jgi:outer membrane autotransporter protein